MKSLINPPELFPNLEKSPGAGRSIIHCQVVIGGHRLGFHRVERNLSSPAVVSDHAHAVNSQQNRQGGSKEVIVRMRSTEEHASLSGGEGKS